MWNTPPETALSGLSTGRTKQSLSASKSDGRRPGLGSEAAVPTASFASRAPSPPGRAGSARAASRTREGPARRVTLDPPPCFGPQFPQSGLAPGASRELAPVEQQAPHTPPSASRLPALLTLEGGRSRDAHHRRTPPPCASRLHPRPGSLGGAAARPGAAKLASPSSATAAAANAAVRPRAAPPPWLAPPRPPGTPPPRARPTNAHGSPAPRPAPAKPRPFRANLPPYPGASSFSSPPPLCHARPSRARPTRLPLGFRLWPGRRPRPGGGGKGLGGGA